MKFHSTILTFNPAQIFPCMKIILSSKRFSVYEVPAIPTLRYARYRNVYMKWKAEWYGAYTHDF